MRSYIFSLSKVLANHSLSHSIILGANKSANSDLSGFALVKSGLNSVLLFAAN